MKSYIWIGGIIVALIALMFWSVKSSSSIEPPLSVEAVHELDNVKGNASSSVVLIEYSDFECPACRVYAGITKELMVEFGDRIAFVYRHFPLTGIHANAELAARAAEAARKQGKFWEMHDLLFEKQDEWSRVADIEPLFESYATLLNISVEQFKKDWLSVEIKDLVRAERADAIKLGLPGTPSFFLNGKQIQNPSSAEAFKALIRATIDNRK